MYTYESFERLGAFILLRPIFLTFLIISLLLFLVVVIPRLKNKIINGFTVICISTISVVVTSQLLFYDAIIVDEINLGGDGVSTYMFLAIIVFSILNTILFFISGERKVITSSTPVEIKKLKTENE